MENHQDEIRRYNRNTLLIQVITVAVLVAILGGVITAVAISIEHDNEFTKQCNDAGGWVASHDPLICVDNDNRVIRIKQ